MNRDAGWDSGLQLELRRSSGMNSATTYSSHSAVPASLSGFDTQWSTICFHRLTSNGAPFSFQTVAPITDHETFLFAPPLQTFNSKLSFIYDCLSYSASSCSRLGGQVPALEGDVGWDSKVVTLSKRGLLRSKMGPLLSAPAVPAHSQACLTLCSGSLPVD